MKMLAIDTSTQVMAVALVDMESQQVIGKVMTNVPRNHSTSLMPTVSHLLHIVGVEPEELGKVAVSSGPGSYTGLRIGVATAKMLSWTLDIPLYSASSLAVLAMNGLRWSGVIIPLFDARRGRVYSGMYRMEEGHLIEMLEDCILPIEEWLYEIKELGFSALFLGDDVNRFRDIIQEILGDLAHFGTIAENAPCAVLLALLAYRRWENQQPAEKDLFAPNYCQITEAEAKLLKQQEAEQ